MTKNKKSDDKMQLADLVKYPFKHKMQKQFSYPLTVIYLLLLLLILSIISVLKNNIENYSLISDLRVFLYSSAGLMVLMTIPFTLFYTFLCAYEHDRKRYVKGLLITAVTFLPFLILGNLTDYISQYLAVPQLLLPSILLILAFMAYSFIAFTMTIKNLYNTTYSRIISSVIFTFVTFVLVLMSGYIMQLVSIMR